jgi:hypothetical protein
MCCSLLAAAAGGGAVSSCTLLLICCSGDCDLPICGSGWRAAASMPAVAGGVGAASMPAVAGGVGALVCAALGSRAASGWSVAFVPAVVKNAVMLCCTPVA